MEAGTLKRTPLYEAHVEAGAKIVDFAGWEMPVQYDGIREEHVRVRTSCGVFDVSHMGEVETEAGSDRLVPKTSTTSSRRADAGMAEMSVGTAEARSFLAL